MPKLGPLTPILRIFDVAKAHEFYVGFLGFEVQWEHRFGKDAPLYTEVSRDGCVLHLSEHYGDASPGSAVRIRVEDIASLHRELTGQELPVRQTRLRNDAMENAGNLGRRPVRQPAAFLRGDGGIPPQAEALTPAPDSALPERG